MTELTAEKRAELRRLADAIKSARDTHAIHRSIISLNALEDRRRDLQQATDDTTVLSLLDALDAAEARLAAIGDAWARYQRNELSQEEFEGTVAERVE